MNRKWFRVLLRQRVWMILLLVLQVVFFGYMIASGSQVSKALDRILRILSVIVVLHVVSKKDKGGYKITWVVLILIFPLFGGLMYLMFHVQSSSRHFASEIKRSEEKAAPLFALPGDSYYAAREQMGKDFNQVRYLQDYAGFPVYSNTGTKFLSPGEKMLEALLPELEKAEKYIFLDFFIVEDGIMWGQIADILQRKAAAGVKVRLIYDDLGCFLTLPVDFRKQFGERGIESVVFNPFRPFLTVKQNNRDHRKIISIDGKVAFTGGINLADEYINAKVKHGHWKDSAVMLEGKAAWSFTLIFLQMWQACTKTEEDFSAYYPWKDSECAVSSDGFVQPYADSPTDTENVGEHVYLQILNLAQDYVYINTPYLIVDDSMVSALTLAAKRGVDVRIITPHKWDKWVVHMTTRSYYRELTKAGVKIYEYTSGFNHSKTFVADDTIATVGTTNLDFRSLYLHFECGTWMFGSAAVMEVKEDFLNTLDICQPVTEKDCNPKVIVRLFQDILRLFAPLM